VRRGPAVTAAIAAVVVAVDQAAKFAVRTTLPTPGSSVPVLGDLVRFTFTRNEGAAYGMLPGGRIWFILVSVVAVCVIAGYLIRRRPQKVWLIVALGLVAGGAIGNLIDRAWFGWVTDFIQAPFDFPVFNVADSSVVVGVAMLVWWLLFGPAPAVIATPSIAAEGSSSDGPAEEA
jgi:signal peptidase II